MIVTASSAGVSRAPYLRYTLRYDFYTDGSVHITLDGPVRENATWLPRLGFSFGLAKEHAQFRYFGDGPMESYCDMCHHGTVDWDDSCAADEYVPYVRPQEHGNHVHTRCLRLGGGLEFRENDEMDICASEYDTRMIQPRIRMSYASLM